jgi:LysM repeat protein
MAFDTLTELAAALEAEAPGGTIRLDSAFLSKRVVDLIAKYLPPLTDTVTLGSKSAKISLQNDRSGTPTLWLQDLTLPADKKEGPLNLASCPADVAIQQTTAGDPTGYDLVIRIALPSAWKFGDSLPQLWGAQPPEYLVTPTGQDLYFSSFEAMRPLPGFPGEPEPSDRTKVLGTGLTYYADLKLSGVFALAEKLLGLPEPVVHLSGPVTPDPVKPEVELRAHPDADPLEIGFLKLGVPFVGVKTEWVDPKEEPEPPAGEEALSEPTLPVLAAGAEVEAAESELYPIFLFYVGADIEIDPHDAGEIESHEEAEGVGIELRAVFTDPGSTDFLLVLGAPPGQKLSLGSLATKLLHTDGDSMKKEAASLSSYLDAITLESFTAAVSPGASTPIQYVRAQIGTEPPWKIGPNDEYELDLTFTWTTLFLGSGKTAWMAEFESLLRLGEKLAFDVTVTVPELTIAGSELGTVELSLTDLKTIFPLEVPEGLLDLTLTNFYAALAADAKGTIKSFSLSGTAGLSIAPFGTPLLALENVNIALAVDPVKDQHTLALDGEILLGGALRLAGSATVSNVPETNTVFTLHLVDETVGSMLNHLVHLVDPTFDLTMPAPWDRFLAISLDAFVLEVDLTDETVSLDYEATIDLEFLKLTKLGLTYARKPKKGEGKQPPKVTVDVEGTFLGTPFGKGKENPPLSWDPVNESPPSVPGKTTVLDLRYAGLGQHIGFSGEQPTTIPEVLKDLKASVLPVQPGQLPQFGTDKGELGFEAGAGWLIGADLTVMSTVSIGAIFNDPNLYGIRIGLEGERAKVFAGLQFEILYRKVTETIGVYHIELTLPTAMRNLQFGAVSLTLPIVVLDIYTNGNFRIDLGFPKGLDFSNSFCLQVFPFVGYGGFYFALLDGATSSRVPQITNGEFHPVIEFGVGLQVGVGKTIDEGVLSGGLSVTVIGIVEGLVAWFHPTDSSPEETYYQLHGAIAVIGHLYATIDFAIIQASIDVTAKLSVTLAIESHQPILIEASASVSVRVSVKIVLFTIHLSFSATISASFTIGSATPTPWKLKAPGGGTAALAARAGRRLPAPAPVLALPAGHRRAIRRALVAGTVTPIENWPAVPVFPDGKQEAKLWTLTSFTRGEASGSPRAVLLLGAENSISEGARTAAEHQEVVGSEPEKKAFNLLAEAMLRWGVYAETHPAIAAGGAVRKGGTTTITTERPHGFLSGTPVTLAGVTDPSFNGAVTVAEVLTPTSFTCDQQGADASSGGGTASSGSVSADQLEDLRQSLSLAETVAAAFGSETLEGFLAANLALEVEPAGKAGENTTGVAMFPIAPGITLTDTAGTDVNFGTHEEVTRAYQENVRAYFESLQVQFEKEHEGGEGGKAALAATPAKASMASVLFSQYFNMLMSQGAKAAIELLAALPFRTGSSAMSVSEIGTALSDPALVTEPLRIVAPNQASKVLRTGAAIALPDVTHQVRSGESLASIAAGLGKLGARDPSGGEYTAATLLKENAGPLKETAGPEANAIFSVGIPVPYDGITYVTQAGDTLELVAARLLVRIGGPALVNGLLHLADEVQALLKLNPAITGPSQPIVAGTTVKVPGGSYTAVAGDTPTLVAAYRVAVTSKAISPAVLVRELVEANKPSITDPTKEQPVGTVLKIPRLVRAMAAGDSVESIAQTLIAPQGTVEASLLAVPAATQLLSPHAVLATPMRYLVAAEDTLAKIATKLGISLADLAGPAAEAAGLFAPEQKVTVEDVPAIAVDALMEALLAEGEWNTAAGMVSRFLLSGLRLPDPKDPTFERLTPEQLRDPKVLAKIPTKPLYELTGQQFEIAGTPPPSYEITLTKGSSGPGWMKLGTGGSSLSYPLNEEERGLLSKVASTSPEPEIQTATRLALLQMLPTRTALRRQIAWQAAQPPLAGGGAGNPSLWTFPEHLIEAIVGAHGDSPLLYEVAAIANALPDKAVELGSYAWATLVDLTISLPQVKGDAPAAANAYVVEGADDTGANLLQQLHGAAEHGTKMRLFLLYQPDPAGSRPSGLASDVLEAKQTWMLKANLTTLTSSGGDQLTTAVEADPTGAYAASIEDPAEFLALLWEASITRSGGFYLNYVNADGGTALPGTVFGSGSTARLSLLAIPDAGSAPPGPLKPFHNCAVAAESVDPGSTTVVVQPVAYEVVKGDSLTSVQEAFAKHKPGISVVEVAQINAAVPQILLLGAEITIPGRDKPYVIAYGDTLASIVTDNPGVTIEALVNAGGNATAPILAPGAQMQPVPGALSPSATAPPGTVGFELVRPNPDPDNLPYKQLSAAELVNSLFNLTAWSLGEEGGFLPSGEGLPTIPTEAGKDWSYAQALGVAPYAESSHGSASAALPAAAENPYNGVEVEGKRGEATLLLKLQDVYGNQQPPPSKFQSVPVPVGYFDEVIGLSAWPSLAMSYLVEKPATVALSMTLQQDRYVPSASVPVDSALAAIKADLASYRRIYYQLAQPDLGFTLRTTLALDSDPEHEGKPRVYKLPKSPFLAFSRGAYVQLAALSTLAPVNFEAGGKTVAQVREEFGVTASLLLGNNQDRLYSALFGEATLEVPAVYTTVQNDNLHGIAERQKGITVAKLAKQNEGLPLNPGAVLSTPVRKQKVQAGQSLAKVAAAANASVPGLAVANASRPGLLAAEVELVVGTKTYLTTTEDTLENAANKLESPVGDVALANQFLSGLLVAEKELDVTDVVVAKGNTFASLASHYDAAGGVKGLAEENEKVANVFAPATSLQVGLSGSVQAPHPSDTLLTFAQANRVTVDQLAAANEGAAFAAGAEIEIPATLEQSSAPRWCTYPAQATDTLGDIAELFGTGAAEIVELNPDLPGLLAPGQTVRDSTSGTSVATAAEDSFEAVKARFLSEHSVTVSLAQLAADVAKQEKLLQPGGLWICPPMRGDAYGKNAGHSLAGLATAYGTDVGTLAATNAATRGLLAGGVKLALPEWPSSPEPITTKAGETFNSLVTRLEEAGVTKTVGQVAADVSQVSGLIEKEASVVPVPPPSPADSVAIEPHFRDATFQLVLQITAEREGDLIDPDFSEAAAVAAATTTIAPHPDPQGKGDDALGLGEFAARLQEALPGLAVATGAPAVEGEPTASSTVWCVNFDKKNGPALTYELSETASYFALPPLSPSLMAGTVKVKPYTSESGLGPEEERSFQAIDLDVWLNSFLEAVDVFLSPAYAVPAYTASPADVEAVVQAKQELADAISQRVTNVLEEKPAGASAPSPSPADAIERMRQAMLQQLGNATKISTLVQLPASVTSSPSSDPSVAPRLSGRLAPPPEGKSGTKESPDSYSFSTAKLPLTAPQSAATFLFTVKAPAESSHVGVKVGYAVSEIELPDPASKIGEYEGSSWLKLVDPLMPSATMELEIPVPLRAYPSPVTLVSQSAEQSFAEPEDADKLLGWDFDFVYQHDDAGQDTPLVEVAFDPAADDMRLTSPDGLDLNAVFAALAQFTTVEQALGRDLGKLPQLAAGTTNPTTTAAVKTLAAIVKGVAGAFTREMELGVPYKPSPKTLYYRFVREQTETTPAQLARLVVTSVDPVSGEPRKNQILLWPAVWVVVDGKPQPLTRVGERNETEVVYAYPPGIAADAAVEELFGFALDGSSPSAPSTAVAIGAELAGPKVFSFQNANAIAHQSGRAGVSIWRNWSLVPGVTTNRAFVYQTPITRFPAVATPAILATNPIELGKSKSTSLAGALGEFLEELTKEETWEAEGTLTLRLGCGYRYSVASAEGTELDSVVPIFLVPSVDFHPAADWKASTSFVSQVAAMAEKWRSEEGPSPEGGAFVFDLTIYASGGQLQPLIHATSLLYDLAGRDA